MVFDLCDDISECLGRLQLGALLGHFLTPGRGAWAMSSLGGPLIEGWGTEQGNGGQHVNSGPISE